MGPMHALRSYQLKIGRAIMDSVVRRRGLTLTVEIARQGGKNELSAQVETLLMTMSVVRGGNLIKAAPTFLPQAMISMNRLRERLDEVGFAGHWRMDSGNAVVLGKARQIFLSAEPHANVVGNTAHILLEMDEAQVHTAGEVLQGVPAHGGVHQRDDGPLRDSLGRALPFG